LARHKQRMYSQQNRAHERIRKVLLRTARVGDHFLERVHHLRDTPPQVPHARDVSRLNRGEGDREEEGERGSAWGDRRVRVTKRER
jgi:hypothetical protein